jgi:ribonuclease BN (tRNA processing enzyme)
MMRRRWTRRDWLRAATLAPWLPASMARSWAQTDRTRLILLGTSGGPRPKIDRAATSQVILVGDDAYVVDCGDGVCQRLVAAGVDLQRLRKVFITHHHSDHNADYGNLLLLSWAAGLRSPVDTYGPPPLARMTELYFELNAYDIETRMDDEERVPLVPLVTAHEISAGGVVAEDDHVRVTAALADHPPVTPALAYRFDTADRSIVMSGDTAYSENVLELARDADVLVHEALFVPGLERTVAKAPNAPRLLEHIIASHTTAEDAGRLAAAARVKMLVLSHLVPADDPAVGPDVFRTEAAKHYSGEIIVAADLMEI